VIADVETDAVLSVDEDVDLVSDEVNSLKRDHYDVSIGNFSVYAVRFILSLQSCDAAIWVSGIPVLFVKNST